MTASGPNGDIPKKTPRKKPLLKKSKRSNPKTGRQRKAKRRERKLSEAEQKSKDDAAKADHWEGGRTDQLLLRKALNKRWGTDMTAADVEKALRSGDASLRTLAMAIIRKGMLFKSEKTIDEARVNQLAVSNLLRAEQQNQADEHKAQPDKVDLTVTGSQEERVANVLARLRGEIKRQAPAGRAASNGAEK